MCKYRPNRTIYIAKDEQLDIITSLTTAELRLYTILKFSLSENWTPEDYILTNIATREGIHPRTLQNTYYSLKKKGYVDINFFKDAQKETYVKVVIGRDMVQLHQLGLTVAMSSSKELTEALKLYPLNDPTLTKEERIERVKSINEYIESQSTK